MSTSACEHSHLDHARPGNLCLACGAVVEAPHADVVVQLVTYSNEIHYVDGERARYRVRLVKTYSARSALDVLTTGFVFEQRAAAEQVQAAMYSALRTANVATGLDFIDW